MVRFEDSAVTFGGTWRAEAVTSLEAAAALTPEWTDLMARAPGATPFQRPEWVIPWLRIFAPDRAFIVTVRSGDGRLIALLPALRTEGIGLELAGRGITDYLTPIVNEPDVVDACQALRTVLEQDGRRCVFDDVPQDSPWVAAAREDPDWRVEPGSVCPIVALPRTVDAWMKTLPVGLRRNILRYGRRLTDEEDGHCLTVGRDAAPGAALAALFRLHGQRWHERALPGVLQNADVRRFHELSAPGLLAADALRLHLLCSASDVIAAQYVLVDRQRAYAYIGGFDPEWSRYSPGVLLMAYSIARAIEDGCVEFDLLRGAEPYKYAWGAIDRISARLSRRGDVDAERL